MSFKNVIFDLDGTLLNTLEDLAESMNITLEQLGFPSHPTDSYRHFVGDGMDMLALRVLPEQKRSPEIVSMLVSQMSSEYHKRWHSKTGPYIGIKELLIKLKKINISLSVLSNKPHDFVNDIIPYYFDSDLFSEVIGAGIFPKKPDPTGVYHIIMRLGASPVECMFIGDTGTDMKTAKTAGIYAVGALWGFRDKNELIENGADKLINNPLDLLDLFC